MSVDQIFSSAKVADISFTMSCWCQGTNPINRFNLTIDFNGFFFTFILDKSEENSKATAVYFRAFSSFLYKLHANASRYHDLFIKLLAFPFTAPSIFFAVILQKLTENHIFGGSFHSRP